MCKSNRRLCCIDALCTSGVPIVSETGRDGGYSMLVKQYGGIIESGPRVFPIHPTYYAVYFLDSCGNRYEMVHRLDDE